MDEQKLKQQIANMEAELAAMKAELGKPKEFKWAYKDRNTFYVGHDAITSGTSATEIGVINGRCRTTKANAEYSLERNRLANRLEALVEQMDTEWKADWSDRNQKKSYIYYGHTDNAYFFTTDFYSEDIGKVYMSPSTADKICTMLNNKEIIL